MEAARETIAIVHAIATVGWSSPFIRDEVFGSPDFCNVIAPRDRREAVRAVRSSTRPGGCSSNPWGANIC